MRIERLVVSPLAVNCYIVGDEQADEGIIIDPGDEAGRIVDAMRRLGWKAAAILNTHAHVDHIAAAQEVKEALGARLYLHPDEAIHLPRLVEHGAMYGIYDARVPTVDVELSDGDRVPFGSLAVEVTLTPGHTPGHCIFAVGDDIFCGDLIFAGSIGRTDLPGGNYEAMLISLERAVMTLPGHTRLHPGHGESTTVSIEQRFNPFLQGLSAQQADE
ncbi:MAG TPA: MBL fold metallo-hydrolase [Acidobacteriota bacterium]|nr:MBL fold metallo-hydrolase [Acidobacteriota bacterium]